MLSSAIDDGFTEAGGRLDDAISEKVKDLICRESRFRKLN